MLNLSLTKGISLTSKQARELSNDLDRLEVSLKHQGKSYQDIQKAQSHLQAGIYRNSKCCKSLK